MRSRPSFRRIAATTLETLAWVGLATALVAILDSIATPAGLGSLYLIAVLATIFGPQVTTAGLPASRPRTGVRRAR